jgi:hypothetical protein
MSTLSPSANAVSSDGENRDEVLWRSFLSAQGDEEFFGAWLHLLCQQLPAVPAAAVLLRAEHEGAFVPVALYPASPRDLSFLGPVSEEALRRNAGVLLPASSAERGYNAALPLHSHTDTAGVVAFEISVRREVDAQRVLRQVHWGLGWTADYLARRRSAAVNTEALRLGSVMEVMTTALRPLPQQQLLIELVNQMCRHLQAARVVVGLGEAQRLRATAMSDVAYFEAHSDSAAYYNAAMQEVSEACLPAHYSADATSTSSTPWPAHTRLAAHSRATSILTVPLQFAGRSIGAICAERNTREPFSETQLDWLNALAAVLPQILEQKRTADRSLTSHAASAVHSLVERFFGPRHLTWKCSVAAVLMALTALTALHIDYRVTAHTVIEGEIQRSAVAPFDGFIQLSSARAGDVVHQGQVLCQLDDRDLRLEQDKWRNEREQHARELRQALAGPDLSTVQIVEAQLQQSEAHLQLVEQQLAKARVLAPFDGVVISGDLTQLIGSPIERGKKLFEIAPLQAYRIILEVDESDMRHVAVGQSGTLLVTSAADRPLAFRINAVTPVATSKDGRNYFRVEARLDSAPATLRPGMEGIGKIRAGRGPLWWVLTHGFTDWLRLSVWRYIP